MSQELFDIELFKSQVDSDAVQLNQINISYKNHIRNDRILNDSRRRISHDFEAMGILEKGPQFKTTLKSVSEGLKEISDHQTIYVNNILKLAKIYLNSLIKLKKRF